MAPPPFRLVHWVKRRLRAFREQPTLHIDSTESYSQCGEDRIVAFLCCHMSIAFPTYVDIGANDPVKLSNTYLFYRTGSTGICIEANPVMHQRLTRTRPKDLCLNIGIGPEASAPMPFYQFNEKASGLSTFSKEQAEHNSQFYSHPIERVLDVPLKTINMVLREHLQAPPDFLTIDVEGLDLQILQSYDFGSYAPAIICAETIVHTERGVEKDAALIQFILDQGYTIFADTHVNTIFVRTNRFPAI